MVRPRTGRNVSGYVKVWYQKMLVRSDWLSANEWHLCNALKAWYELNYAFPDWLFNLRCLRKGLNI